MGIYIGKQDKLVEGIISSDAFKSLATKEELNSLKEELIGKKVFNNKLDDEINQLFDSIAKSSKEQAEDIEGLRSLKNEFVDSYKTSNPELVNQELERIKTKLTGLESALGEIKNEETALNQESHEKKDKDAKKNELDEKKKKFNSSLKGFETSLKKLLPVNVDTIEKLEKNMGISADGELGGYILQLSNAVQSILVMVRGSEKDNKGSLNSEIESLTKKIEDVINSLKDYSGIEEALNSHKAKIEATLNSHKGNIEAALNSHKGNIYKILAGLKDQINGLTNDSGSLEELQKRINSAIESFEKINSQELQTKLEKLVETITSIPSKIEEVLDQLATKEDIKNELRTLNDLSDKIFDILKELSNNSEIKVGNLNTEITKIAQKLETLAKSEDVKKISDELEEVATKEEVVTAISSGVEIIGKKFEEVAKIADVKDVSEKIEKLDCVKNDTFRSGITAISGEIGAISGKLDEVAKSEDVKKVSDKLEEVATKEEVVTAISSGVEIVNDKLEEVAKFAIEKLAKDVLDIKSETEKINKEKEILRTEREQLSVERKKVSELENGLQNEREQLRRALESVPAIMEREKSVNQDLKWIADEKIKITKANADIAQKEKQIADEEKKIADTNASIAKKEKQIVEENNRINNANEEIAIKENWIAKEDQRIAEANKAIAQKESQIVDENKKIEAANNAIAEKENWIAKEDQRIAEANEAIAQKEVWIKKSKDSYNSIFQQDLNSIKSEIQKLAENAKRSYPNSDIAIFIGDAMGSYNKFFASVNQLLEQDNASCRIDINKLMTESLKLYGWANYILRLASYSKLQSFRCKSLNSNISKLEALTTMFFMQQGIKLNMPLLLVDSANNEAYIYNNKNTIWSQMFCDFDAAAYGGKIIDMIEPGYKSYMQDTELQKPVVYHN